MPTASLSECREALAASGSDVNAAAQALLARAGMMETGMSATDGDEDPLLAAERLLADL